LTTAYDKDPKNINSELKPHCVAHIAPEFRQNVLLFGKRLVKSLKASRLECKHLDLEEKTLKRNKCKSCVKCIKGIRSSKYNRCVACKDSFILCRQCANTQEEAGSSASSSSDDSAFGLYMAPNACDQTMQTLTTGGATKSWNLDYSIYERDLRYDNEEDEVLRLETEIDGAGAGAGGDDSGGDAPIDALGNLDAQSEDLDIGMSGSEAFPDSVDGDVEGSSFIVHEDEESAAVKPPPAKKRNIKVIPIEHEPDSDIEIVHVDDDSKSESLDLIKLFANVKSISMVNNILPT